MTARPGLTPRPPLRPGEGGNTQGSESALPASAKTARPLSPSGTEGVLAPRPARSAASVRRRGRPEQRDARIRRFALATITLALLIVAACPAAELPRPWTATASSNPADAALAIDGAALTAWRSDAPQAVGDFLQIDLGAERVVQQVRILTGRRHPSNFPRGLEVAVSRDGAEFEAVAQTENLNRQELRLCFNPRVARHVRLALTDSSGYRWAVAEVRIEGAEDPAALNERDAVVIAADAAPVVRFAAEDLRDYLSEATGSYLSLVTDAEADRFPGTKYTVGRSALTADHLGDLQAHSDEAVLLRAVGDTVIIAGNTPRASAYAAWRLLHRLGVRWYTPGEDGEYVPRLDAIDLAGLDLVQEPSITIRWMSSVRNDRLDEDVTWALRNCLSWVTESVMHYFGEHTGIAWTPPMLDWPYGHYPHSFQRIVPASVLQQHPDMQPMFDGERMLYQGQADNFCTSSPEAVEVVVGKVLEWFRANPDSRSFSICPQDGSRWCECPRCQALDEPLRMENFSRQDMRDVCDRFFSFLNQVAERVAAEFPDHTITTIAYANWHQPPRFDVHPNILVNVCQYGCSSHAASDPSCERNLEMARRMAGWRERTTLLGVYDYVLLNMTAPRTPHPYGRSIPEEMRWLANDLHIMSWWSESAGALWQWSPASFWLAFQMAWDADQDPEALLDEFYADYYGPAAGAREYWEILERRVHQDGVHYGSYNNRPSPQMFTPETIAALGAALQRAEGEAPAGSVYARRVAMLRESLEFVQAYPMEQQ